MSKIENFGILASLSWNHNKWADEPILIDRKASKYSFVIQNGTLYESITFGHKKFKPESGKIYIGYTPTFQSRLPDETHAKEVRMLFFRSLNPNNKMMYIVGLYAYPELGKFDRTANDPMYKYYRWGNIKAKVDNIICFDKPIPINNHIVQQANLLPQFKKISMRGWNYLSYNNVMNILHEALIFNPKQRTIQTVRNRIREEMLKDKKQV